jgi:tRNA-splicing endonuclease subunit Sen2
MEQGTYPPSASILPLFITPTALSSSKPALRPDDPFLVSYVAYHHFRSLGWVVKPGIKFAADWLLYRRGPVFSHSAQVYYCDLDCQADSLDLRWF